MEKSIRALALTIVYFDYTTYQPSTKEELKAFNAHDVHTFYHADRSVTRNGHFELDDLKRGFHDTDLKKALQNLCKGVFDWPWQLDQTKHGIIQGEFSKSMKITYTGCYTDTLRDIKVFLDIGPDQPNTVVFRTLFNQLKLQYENIKADREQRKRKQPEASSRQLQSGTIPYEDIINPLVEVVEKVVVDVEVVIASIKRMNAEEVNTVFDIVKERREQLEESREEEADEEFRLTKPKRGRPQRSTSELQRQVSLYRRRNNHFKTNTAMTPKVLFKQAGSIPTTEKDVNYNDEVLSSEESMNRLIVQAYEAGSFMRERNSTGQMTLSLRAGVLCAHLHSVCGVSLEKMPFVVAAVLVMVFGKVSLPTLSAINANTGAYKSAMEKVNIKLNASILRRFTDDSHSDSYVGVCLCQDASTKSGRELVNKPYTALTQDNRYTTLSLLYHTSPSLISITSYVRLVQHCFASDVTSTKKAGGGAEVTCESLGSQITVEGTIKITCGMADAFGLAEMKLVLTKIDNQAKLMFDEGDVERLTYKSKRIAGQVYHYGGKWRSTRWLSCRCHAIERCLQPLLVQILNVQGLKNEAHTAQNLYSISHYMKKFSELIDAMHVVSAGWDINSVDKSVPESMRRMLKKICLTRWLTSEYSCNQLWEMMNVPATREFLDFFEEDYHGNMDELTDLYAFMSCPEDKDKPSYLIIMMLYLSNHTPGGVSGEGFTRCHQLAAFLCSPYHRVAIRFTMSLLPVHKRWMAFANGVSQVHDGRVETIGTRAIELVPTERSILAEMYMMRDDHHAFFPEWSEYLRDEAGRAVAMQDDQWVYVSLMQLRFVASLLRV